MHESLALRNQLPKTRKPRISSRKETRVMLCGRNKEICEHDKICQTINVCQIEICARREEIRYRTPRNSVFVIHTETPSHPHHQVLTSVGYLSEGKKCGRAALAVVDTTAASYPTATYSSVS